MPRGEEGDRAVVVAHGAKMGPSLSCWLERPSKKLYRVNNIMLRTSNWPHKMRYVSTKSTVGGSSTNHSSNYSQWGDQCVQCRKVFYRMVSNRRVSCKKTISRDSSFRM